MESIVVAVGVSVGTAQLGGSEKSDSRSHQGKEDDRGTADGPQQPQALRLGVLGVCGAVLIAGNVAPTEEIMMIASEANGWRLLGIAVVSMFLCTLVMYFSEFRGSGVHEYTRVDSVLGVSFTYCIALVTSALLLLLFDSFADLSNDMRLAQTVVLGLPASLGASAGRLLLQQG
jgi:putative integral membrane protein (TIGR02587 family)